MYDNGDGKNGQAHTEAAYATRRLSHGPAPRQSGRHRDAYWQSHLPRHGHHRLSEEQRQTGSGATMNHPGRRSSMIGARMIFLSTKLSASRSEASRSSAANRRHENAFFRGGTNAIIRRALEKEPESPLFPASIRKTGMLSRRPLVRTDAADMLKRRLKQAGLPAHYSPHSFRATGITNFLENDGTLEAAQRIAGHADSRTTKLYDRRGQKVLLEDMERIRY